MPSDEWHEISLLFAEYLIRLNGFETVNLGQNVPFIDIEYVIKKTKPDFLLTFLVSDPHVSEIHNLQKLLSTKYKSTQCLLSGSPLFTEQFQKSKNLVVLGSPSELLKYL